MQIQCTQCGGSVALQEGTQFATCPFCSSALYLDKSKVVFHFVVSPTIAQDQALGNLKRWMAGNETAKDLDSLAKITNQELLYFPMWRFVINEGSQQYEVSEMASSFAIADIKSIPLSGGDLKFYSPKEFEGVPLKEPDILLDSAIHWLQRKGIQTQYVRETNLIHIPFYLFKYDFRGNTFQAVVDAVSGRVLTSVYPPRAERPFVWMSVASILVFFVEGLLAPFWWIRIPLYLVTAVPIGLAAYFVVKKY